MNLKQSEEVEFIAVNVDIKPKCCHKKQSVKQSVRNGNYRKTSENDGKHQLTYLLL